MNIGYYDQHPNSALTSVVVIAREEGHGLENYDVIPTGEAKTPDVFIINPTFRESSSSSYWERVRVCVQKNPQTRFVMTMPIPSERRNAHESLRGLANAEFIGFREVGRLLDILTKK